MTQRVKVAIGRTFNTGNYESIRIDIGLEADTGDGDDTTLLADALFTEALDGLNKKAAHLGLGLKVTL